MTVGGMVKLLSGMYIEVIGMQGQLNKKKYGIALLCVLILTILLFLLFFRGKTEKVEKQLELGAQYLDELNYEQAVAAYTSVLEIDPRNAEAVSALCDTYIVWADSMEESVGQLMLLNEALMKISKWFSYAEEEYRWVVYDLCSKVAEIYETNDAGELSQKYYFRCKDIHEQAEYTEDVLEEIISELPDEIKQLQNEKEKEEQKLKEAEEEYQGMLEELVDTVEKVIVKKC